MWRCEIHHRANYIFSGPLGTLTNLRQFENRVSLMSVTGVGEGAAEGGAGAVEMLRRVSQTKFINSYH